MSNTKKPQKTPEAIKGLIARISLMILRINEQGKYHAFSDIAGHINLLTVRVTHGTTDYKSQNSYDYLLHQEIYYRPDRNARKDLKEETSRIITTLNDMLDNLREYAKPPARRRKSEPKQLEVAA